MSDKRIFLETMFDGFTPDSVSREELISILLDDLMVVSLRITCRSSILRTAGMRKKRSSRSMSRCAKTLRSESSRS